MGKFTPLDFNKYAALARQAAAEGCVLLKNENEALPLRKGDKVAVFGRIAFHYYKSGLGSGGLVNTKYVVGILDALKEEKDITLDENLLGTYEKWIEKNPYDEGQGAVVPKRDGADRRDRGECKRRRCSHRCCRPYRR